MAARQPALLVRVFYNSDVSLSQHLGTTSSLSVGQAPSLHACDSAPPASRPGDHVRREPRLARMPWERLRLTVTSVLSEENKQRCRRLT